MKVTHWRFVLAALLGVAVGTSAGCTPERVSPAPASHPATTTKIEVHTPKFSDVPPPAEVPVAQAWNRDAIQQFEAFGADGRAWMPLTVSTTGTFVGNAPRQAGQSHGAVITYQPSTKQFETIAPLADTSQVTYADIDDHYLVWTEILDQTMLNWKIHLWDRAQKKDRVIAESGKDETGQGFPGPLPQPKLLADRVVYSMSIGKPTETGTSVMVKQYTLSSGTVTDLVKGSDPAVGTDTTLWIGRDDQWRSGALFWNKGGKVEQLTQGTPINFFATDGTSLAYSSLDQSAASNPSWRLGFISNGTERLLLKTDASNALQNVTMSSRLVAWTAYNLLQVYDRKLDNLVTLETKDASYCNAFTNEHYFYWTTPIPQTDAERNQARQNGIYPALIHLVDLSKLH